MDQAMTELTEPRREATAGSLTLRRMEDPVEEHVMPPPRTRPGRPGPAVKSSARRVLSEEEYVEAIGRIVERDFFPHLADHGGNGDGDTKADEFARSSSLDVFLAGHTSEDNASFEEVHRRDIEDKRRRLHWAYDAGDGRREGMLALYHMGGRVLSVEDRQRVDRLLEEAADPIDGRPNGADPWRFRVRNQLMFPPELEDSRDVCLVGQDPSGHRALPPPSQLQLTDPRASRTGPPARSERKTIAHRNTRLPLTGPPEPSPLERPHSPSVYSQADSLDVPAPSRGAERSYRQVPMTPLIEPGALASPLITWGDVMATPLALPAETGTKRSRGQDQSPQLPSFTIGGPSAREELARKLDSSGSTAAKRPRKVAGPGGQPLTPAAISLASRVRSSTAPPTPFGEDVALRASYAVSKGKDCSWK